MTDSSPAAAAQAAAEAIRRYNHATTAPGSINLADLYTIVAAFSDLAARLTQALNQTTVALANQHGLAAETGTDPYVIKHDALTELTIAVGGARHITSSLNTAWGILGRLGQHDTEETAR